MNYKRILKNQQLRFMILSWLKFIPNNIMLKIQYYIKMGFLPNFSNPKRFTEKIQVYKLLYRNPLLPICVDKYKVRGYIESLGMSSILNELYGVYNDANEINFDSLPDKFVIKSTDGSGGQNIFVCKDKTKVDIPKLRKTINKWRNKKNINPGREWAYTGIKNSQIIIEKYIESNIEDGGLIDYKFFCFNGKVEYLYVIADRELGNKCGLGIYDREFHRLNVCRADERKLERLIPKPKNFDQMMRTAEYLSKGFPHVRIDLYNINEQIIFGEYTFYDGSGYMKFIPDSFDFELGEKFDYPL